MTTENTIVITGGASGIGLAAAEFFLKKDFKVFLIDRNDEALAKVQESLKVFQKNIQTAVCDITDYQQVGEVMDQCIEHFGQINAVLPSAGIIKDSFFIRTDKETGKVKQAMTYEQFHDVVDVNLVGSFNTLQQAAIRMVDNRWPGVLYVVSSINQMGQLGQLNYCSTKHALALWPKILVGEFHQQEIDFIRVVGISPGYVDTPILRAIRSEIQNKITGDIALGRFLNVDEITATLWHIWENQAINATTIEVSGGIVQRGVCK